jgi:hypothetical protein
MKFKDIKPGMMVAIGTRQQMFDGDAECAVVLEVGGWNDRDAGGGPNFPIFKTNPTQRFFKGGGKGVAIATSHEMVRRYFDGKYAKRPKWYPAVVQANRILCPWDDAMSKFGKVKAQRDESRRETKAQRRDAKKVAAHLARMGVRFELNEYRRSITLDSDQMKQLQTLLVDLMPNSMQATLPKMVVHWEGPDSKTAVCGATGIGPLGKGDPRKVGVRYWETEDVTCPKCLALLKSQQDAA